MELREFGPDDASAIEAFVEVGNACKAVDAPWQHPDTPFRRRMDMIHAWDGEPGRNFLAHAGGAVVGTLTIDASDYDNLELAWLGLAIHPDHRRRGHGTAALEAAYDICREMGRPLLGADGWESEHALGFASANGFELKSQAINRRQRLAELPAGLVEKLYEDALEQAGDYELLRFSGGTPDDLIPAVAALTGAINDAPLDDLEMEDEAFPPDRIRAYEYSQRESGFRFRRLVARHRATGELAGHTVVTVDSERPELGDQHDTAVVRAHRGHRLGVLLKAGMLLWLAEEEPQLETIDTWNAESNDHMIFVNEQLGYRVMGREFQFQRRI